MILIENSPSSSLTKRGSGKVTSASLPMKLSPPAGMLVILPKKLRTPAGMLVLL